MRLLTSTKTSVRPHRHCPTRADMTSARKSWDADDEPARHPGLACTHAEGWASRHGTDAARSTMTDRWHAAGRRTTPLGPPRRAAWTARGNSFAARPPFRALASARLHVMARGSGGDHALSRRVGVHAGEHGSERRTIDHPEATRSNPTATCRRWTALTCESSSHRRARQRARGRLRPGTVLGLAGRTTSDPPGTHGRPTSGRPEPPAAGDWNGSATAPAMGSAPGSNSAAGNSARRSAQGCRP
jgi:hypothetical protein